MGSVREFSSDSQTPLSYALTANVIMKKKPFFALTKRSPKLSGNSQEAFTRLSPMARVARARMEGGVSTITITRWGDRQELVTVLNDAPCWSVGQFRHESSVGRVQSDSSGVCLSL